MLTRGAKTPEIAILHFIRKNVKFKNLKSYLNYVETSSMFFFQSFKSKYVLCVLGLNVEVHIVSGLFNDIFSSSDCIVSNETIINKRSTGTNMEGSGRVLI
jgi:hypothetical protein